MASGDLVRYVITVMLHEDTLTEINELNTTFGLISPQSEEEIRELVSGLTHSATGKDPEITITTWEEWNSNRK